MIFSKEKAVYLTHAFAATLLTLNIINDHHFKFLIQLLHVEKANDNRILILCGHPYKDKGRLTGWTLTHWTL